jgi:cytochrome P450
MVHTERPTIDLDTVDLADPCWYRDGDPHTVWQAMREREPVRWQPTGESLGFWSVTRYADVDVVLRDHTRFTSQRGTLLNLLGRDDPAGGRQMAVTDPPRHTRMRVPLQRALTVRETERHRDSIRREIRGILAPAVTGEPFDFAEAMAGLPMTVAGTIMNLPRSDWPRLTRLTTMSVAPSDSEFMLPSGATATLETAHRELFAYFANMVVARRRAPGDDLLSLLLTVEVDGRRLDPGEVLSNCYSLLLGANVTTPYVPSAAVAELAGDPRLAAGWLGRPELVGNGMEEALRWSSPANHFMRHTTTEVELGGVRIPEGDAVVAWLGSANRDTAVFADPFTFDIGRRPNRHIAFGAGPHYCVGHGVARVSLRILFEELVTHFEAFESAGEPRHLCSNFVAGISHLPVVARVRPASAHLFGAGSRAPAPGSGMS